MGNNTKMLRATHAVGPSCSLALPRAYWKRKENLLNKPMRLSSQRSCVLVTNEQKCGRRTQVDIVVVVVVSTVREFWIDERTFFPFFLLCGERVVVAVADWLRNNTKVIYVLVFSHPMYMYVYSLMWLCDRACVPVGHVSRSIATVVPSSSYSVACLPLVCYCFLFFLLVVVVGWKNHNDAFGDQHRTTTLPVQQQQQ